MLEKLFGKKSTGIIYIICMVLILFSFAGSLLTYLFLDQGTLISLISFAVLASLAVIFINIPILIQKWFKLYIPPVVEFFICLSCILYFTSYGFYENKTKSFPLFNAAIVGFTVGTVIFCILYSVACYMDEKKNKKIGSFKLILFVFLLSSVLSVAFNSTAYFLSVLTEQISADNHPIFISVLIAHVFGCFIASFIGYLLLEIGNPGKLRIRSFKNSQKAENAALEAHDSTRYAVIRNITDDHTDYRKLLRLIRTKFLLIRIFYLILYLAYLIYVSLSFIKFGGMGITVILNLALGFVLSSLVYIYEYILFVRRTKNQRLRRLKIAKASVRLYTMILLIALTFLSDYTRNELSILISLILFIVNLSSLMYNLFSKPKHYPSTSSHRQNTYTNPEQILDSKQNEPFDNPSEQLKKS